MTNVLPSSVSVVPAALVMVKVIGHVVAAVYSPGKSAEGEL